VLTPSQFQSIDRQTGALRSMVSRLRAGGADVICVLMPETSRLRALAPPIVAEQFDRAIAAVSADGPLRLIDLRDKIPDDMFWDDAHLNPDGRRLLSSQLPSLLP
jgi:lysophospholipase L1-like esterase